MSTRHGANPAATVITAAADLAALVIGVWILMYLLDADRTNGFVDFVHDCAYWLTGWAHGLASVEPDWWQVLLDYGAVALAYLILGHLLARTVGG
ncbi:hypothetical protein ACFQLX_07875 [Streptomyces polyrhachis]|uniref:Integral membrane protein n=1 Tax=Streptomyces polyrhachis TaxID=1282885 RepID=A0ABW2GEE1_9ACTN